MLASHYYYYCATLLPLQLHSYYYCHTNTTTATLLLLLLHYYYYCITTVANLLVLKYYGEKTLALLMHDCANDTHHSTPVFLADHYLLGTTCNFHVNYDC